VDSGLALSREALERPMRQGDPRLLATAQGLADAALRTQPNLRTMAALVADRLPSLLPESATIETAAQAFHMSGRTLQRRLEQDGTTFSDVLDGVRHELARRWLADPALALGEIAFRLGFSDLATFSRAFKRWTGKPPGMWRRS
jgi:AraC-like DNA-binding protein